MKYITDKASDLLMLSVALFPNVLVLSSHDGKIILMSWMHMNGNRKSGKPASFQARGVFQWENMMDAMDAVSVADNKLCWYVWNHYFYIQ